MFLAHKNSLKNQKNVATTQKTEDKQLYPDQTYTDTWCQKFGKERICLSWHGPAHTDGDSIIHFEHSNIVHMGDLMFNRRYPIIDRGAGASIKNWIKVLGKARQKFDKETIFIFGHANEGHEVTGTHNDIQAFENYLQQLLSFVEAEIKAGKTKDEIIKAKEIPGNTEWKGQSPERNLSVAYDELMAK